MIIPIKHQSIQPKTISFNRNIQVRQQPYCNKFKCFAIDSTKIKYIFTDVDGTVLNTSQEVPQKVRDSIRKCQEKGILVIPATGKPIGKWKEMVTEALGDNKAGIYLNGLTIFDNKGIQFYENPLIEETIRDCIKFSHDYDLTLVPYTKDRTFCEVTNEQTDKIWIVKEPTPEPIGDLTKLFGQLPIIKVVFIDSEERCMEVRADLEKMLGDRGVVTRALKGTLEVLPPKCGKAVGVQIYLDHIGLTYDDILAIGDGENDRQMLEQAGVAVVMGNADDNLKKIADYVAPTNDEDGWAVAMDKIIFGQ